MRTYKKSTLIVAFVFAVMLLGAKCGWNMNHPAVEIADNFAATPKLDLHTNRSVQSLAPGGADLLLSPSIIFNEYQAIPYTLFVATTSYSHSQPRLSLYEPNPGIGKRVVAKPIGFLRTELHAVIERGRQMLTPYGGKSHSLRFTFGIFRSVPGVGIEYQLHYKHGWSFRDYETLPKLLYTLPLFHHRQEVVHFVLPLKGRVAMFRAFANRFASSADVNIHLTIVYFGTDHLAEVTLVLKQLKIFDVVRLLQLNEEFSRSRGIQVGFTERESRDLVFVVDVDVAWTAGFLSSCRIHSRPGRSVYYPILFSLYNPYNVYTLYNKKIPKDDTILNISEESGYWRDFGFGMTCQYKQDFDLVRGFEEMNTDGKRWGLEDVFLYRKHLRRGDLRVIRCQEPTLFHVWHAKTCNDIGVDRERRNNCERSRDANEASRAQLAKLLSAANERRILGQ